MHIFQADAGMDGKIVNALFTLFNQCILVNLPIQFGGLAIHLFHGLVDRDSSHWDWAVAYNPLTGFMNVGTC